MKIEMKEKKVVNFEEIEDNECFIYENALYLKGIPESYDESNAVSLKTGEFWYFRRDEKVIPVTAKVIVE